MSTRNASENLTPGLRAEATRQARKLLRTRLDFLNGQIAAEEACTELEARWMLGKPLAPSTLRAIMARVGYANASIGVALPSLRAIPAMRAHSMIEDIESEEADARVDIYAPGAVHCACIARRDPVTRRLVNTDEGCRCRKFTGIKYDPEHATLQLQFEDIPKEKEAEHMKNAFSNGSTRTDVRDDAAHPVAVARAKRDAAMANAWRHVDPPVGGASVAPVRGDHLDADEHPVSKARAENERRMRDAWLRKEGA